MARNFHIAKIGEKINKLTVISFAPNNTRGRKCVECICECGNVKITEVYSFKTGDLKSCGCLIFADNPKRSSAKKIFRREYSDGNLTFEQFLELSQLNCFYCNEKPSNCYNVAYKDYSENFKKNGGFIYSGLDRVDSNLPHHLDNIVPCCKFCNFAKCDYTVEEFCEWIQKSHANLNKQS